MTNKRIEALQKLIAVKDETIKELERQIQLLKNQSPIVIPQAQPYIPSHPIPYPNQPAWPGQQQPLWGTTVVSGADDLINGGSSISPLNSRYNYVVSREMYS